MKRLLVALLLLAVACSGNRPRATSEPTEDPVATERAAAIVTELTAEPNGTATCGAWDLDWHSPDVGGGQPAELTIGSKEHARTEGMRGRDEFEQLLPLWCGDLLGDGSMILGVERYTGGAHCCFTAVVWEVGVDVERELLNEDLGNAGNPAPKQLDDTAPLELVTTNDALSYFGDLPYAASPSFPRVFAFDRERYTDATGEYPDVIRDSLTNANEDLDASLAGGDSISIRGSALGVYAHQVLLGEVDLEALTARLPAEDAEWLNDHAAEARDVVLS